MSFIWNIHTCNGEPAAAADTGKSAVWSRTPFSAEVYFVNTTVRLDVMWGTIDPVQLIDPKYYVKQRIRAFGQMGLGC